jgi:glycosyltransferase involved in cell wall biosynthesis
MLAQWDFSGENILWSIIGWGEETYKEALQNRVKWNASIRVSCLGYKKNEEIYSLLQESDIFLYATHAESFGIAILEAASQWLPLVLMKHEAFVWLWNDTSIFELSEIPIELTRLMSDTDYSTSRSETSLYDARKFEVDVILEKWKRFLNRI